MYSGWDSPKCAGSELYPCKKGLEVEVPQSQIDISSSSVQSVADNLETLAKFSDNADTTISSSIDIAGNAIVDALGPSCFDWIALAASVVSAIAAVVLISVNIRTVKAAQGQIEVAQRQADIGLYPLRRKVLCTLDEDDPCSIHALKHDIELLFSNEAMNAYVNYLENDDRHRFILDLQYGIEQSIKNRDDDDPEKRGLDALEEQGCHMTEEEYRSNKRELLKKANAQVLNPETMEMEHHWWSSIETQAAELQEARDTTKELLRNQLKKEIAASLL